MDENGKRKQKWLCGFTSRADAERALTEALSALDKGTYGAEPPDIGAVPARRVAAGVRLWALDAPERWAEN